MPTVIKNVRVKKAEMDFMRKQVRELLVRIITDTESSDSELNSRIDALSNKVTEYWIDPKKVILFETNTNNND